MLQNHTRVTAELQKSIPVYHSKSVKRDFVALFGRCTGTKPAILRSIFCRLTGDQSASENFTTAEVDARVKEMVETEDDDLIWDLRTMVDPNNMKNITKVKEFIERNVDTTVHERRHDDLTEDNESVSYMATALSAVDLYRRVNKKLDGRSDHSVRHPKAHILLFGYTLKRHLDAFTSLQTAPYNSLRNPVERKMNLAWQGIGIMREETTNFKKKLKSCSGINGIQEVAKNIRC